MAKEKLADQIRANVVRSKEGESKKKQGTGLPKSPNSSAYVAPHRHCTICHTPIKLKRDPPICGDGGCNDEYENRERQRKRWNILLYVAPAIMVLALILPIVLNAA
ncbi:MAG: DUF2116 family Zn-ribbon domain-containing protein [Candidatus Thalassarchaeaceae archaeon]|nr:DUF2116 family Zn-ribbon domain-containing protein [Candidatus Thalassarchaeaceae archaeon]